MNPVILVLLKEVAPTLIMGLVKLAEVLFEDKPKSGAEKKSFVTEFFKTLMSSAPKVFTGGALETWNRIDEHIGTIIDASAAIAFPHEPGDLNAMGEGH